MIDGHRKVIVEVETGALEIYDLVADPGERNDLAGSATAASAAATDPGVARVLAWIAAHPLQSVAK